MICQHVTLPDGTAAIACFSGRRQRCACGKVATKLCDWKVPTKKTGTCDKPLCPACTHVPAPDKDLCPTHAAEWKAR